MWETLEDRFGQAGRLGLAIGAGVIIVFLGLGAYWVLRSDYQVLFADLTPQDTVAMTGELDRQKIPYALNEQDDRSTTILVDKAEVHKTRIKLMGKDIPLHGTVGFELFNNSDFGMTEFAQKINYQRALQGELTRTILSLNEIRDARVLLALPEQGLFKQAASKPKASITLTLKPGQSLRQEQVSGMQRLISAAIPSVLAQDVTIVDQTGVALTRPADGDADPGTSGGAHRLEMKRETETYLSRKATVVLDRALGEGQAMASVDVTLDMDRVQSSTDEILSVPGRGDGPPTGVVVRERETIREGEAPLNAKGASGEKAAASGGSNQSESEYAVGHRVEQVISQPGSIRRIQVAVVVHRPLSPEQREQLRDMVAASVGASPDRGDSIVLHVMDGLSGSEASAKPFETPSREAGKDPASPKFDAFPAHTEGPRSTWLAMIPKPVWVPILAAGTVLGVLLFWSTSTPRARDRRPAELSEGERQAALAKVEAWMREPASSSHAQGNSGIPYGASTPADPTR